MHAPAYHCPACGGPSSSAGPGNCDFCGAVRVPLGVPDPRTSEPCPGCMALVSNGYGFCPRCGAAQGKPDAPTLEDGLPCPGCGEAMSTWALDHQIPDVSGPGYRSGEARIQGCRACGGAWVDRRTLDEMIARARSIAAMVDPTAVRRQTMSMAEAVVYRSCPGCGHKMNRRNFARYSGVVVDECRACGTYFDAGELEAVFAFVRSGGLALRDQRVADEAARERHAIQATRSPALPAETSPSWSTVEAELDLIVWFLRWVGRWLRRISR